MAELGKSLVWLHFCKNQDDPTVATCTKCQISVKYKQGSTTNLHKHLKRHHGVELETVAQKKRTAASSTTTTTSSNKLDADSGSSSCTPTLMTLWTKLPTTIARHKAISMAIAIYIVKDMRPLDSVNGKGFIEQI